MGETVDETLREIESTRSSLERDIDELFDRLPDGATLAAKARTYGAAAAGTVAVVALTAARMSKRAELKERRQEARINAEELARAFSPHEPRADLVEDSGGPRRVAVLVTLAAAIAAGVSFLRARNGA